VRVHELAAEVHLTGGVAARNVVDYRVEPVGLEAHQAHQVATRLALRAML
jgi:hypothetical protein